MVLIKSMNYSGCLLICLFTNLLIYDVFFKLLSHYTKGEGAVVSVNSFLIR